jgi:hypothetical protein
MSEFLHPSAGGRFHTKGAAFIVDDDRKETGAMQIR